jgi:hypothetical protein
MYVKVDQEIVEIFDDDILFIINEEQVSDPVHPHQVKIYLRDSQIVNGYLTEFTTINTKHLFLDEQNIESIRLIFDHYVGHIPKYKRRLESLIKKLKQRIK